MFLNAAQNKTELSHNQRYISQANQLIVILEVFSLIKQQFENPYDK